MSVLITSASDSAAFHIARLLEDENLIFGTIEQMPDITGSKFIRIPAASSPSFTHELLKICIDHQIHEIFPLMKDEIVELSSSRVLFEEFDIKIVIPSINSVYLNFLSPAPQLSKLVVMVNGVFIAGDIPPSSISEMQDENGIFHWDIINEKVIFSLFFI
jgi:hypothetical protein